MPRNFRTGEPHNFKVPGPEKSKQKKQGRKDGSHSSDSQNGPRLTVIYIGRGCLIEEGSSINFIEQKILYGIFTKGKILKNQRFPSFLSYQKSHIIFLQEGRRKKWCTFSFFPFPPRLELPKIWDGIFIVQISLKTSGKGNFFALKNPI